MADSDSSDLSEHSDKEIQTLAPIFLKAKKATKLVAPPPVVSPPKPKRPPSPPHEEALADHGAIAFLVMFRSRFNDAFPSKLPHYGPQDIENGVVDTAPSTEVQQLLCALLGLVLNRKKPVERGHHGRALEEAISSQKSQWPYRWRGVNPIHGGKTFENMLPTERLDLLQTLVMWALTSSEAIQATIKEKYKQQRHGDDENQPLSVQPWGVDADKRRYFLIQGLEDTSFRVYREGSRYTKNAHWWNQAGTIDEVKALATKLQEVDGSQAARRLAQRISNAIPTFEATEEKRHRREYRRQQRQRFTRPEPGFSLYEGRTRGKRMRYTYDDDEAGDSDATSTRRSARQSTRNTPFEAGPTMTSSGRQIRQPRTGTYGESLLGAPPMSTDELTPGYSDPEQVMSRGRTGRSTRSGTEDSEQPVGRGRPTRSGVNGISNPRKRAYNDIDGLSDEDDAEPSGDEWDSDKNDEGDENMPDVGDADDDMSDAVDDESADEERSLVVKLRVSPQAMLQAGSGVPAAAAQNGSITPASAADDTTKAGALKDEALVPDEKPSASTNGALQPNSSPTGPSSYPTPTSAAFVSKDQKPVVATASHTLPGNASFPVMHGENGEGVPGAMGSERADANPGVNGV
ncbi:uncharacterized protein LTR77_007077 [Saxophila tyrrhenica]|uniref:WHIM1 domain-containing protein n=1 Tax=Saxophila tyrrhenica TaxID=1690608 RepID=A0AAV9P3N8_9PEZI|nr:hypothetical protein LTR77_007077 [Saxophila tyrrhenica]